MDDAVDLHVEDVFEHARGEDLGRRPGRDDRSVVHDDHLVTELRRQVQVVERSDRGDPQFAGERQEFELVAHIEVVRRLVEDENARALCKRSGEHDPLALAARKGLPRSVGELDDARTAHRVGDNVAVEFGVSCEYPLMRESAEHDHLVHGQFELGRRLLCHDRQLLRHLTRCERMTVAPIEEHGASSRTGDAVDRLEERRLPRSVRPDDSDEAAGADIEIEPIDEQVISHLDGQVDTGDRDHDATPRRRSR